MAKGYNRYQYETSPRKLEPEYKPRKSKNRKVKKQQTEKQYKENYKNIKNGKKIKRNAILWVSIVFGMLLVISYRNSQITEQFTEVRNLKSNLAAIQKENEQLEVNIESSINLTTIEKEAEEQLGMQKLNNNQKVYVSLPKKDYIEPSVEDIAIKTEKPNWIKNIVSTLLGK